MKRFLILNLIASGLATIGWAAPQPLNIFDSVDRVMEDPAQPTPEPKVTTMDLVRNIYDLGVAAKSTEIAGWTSGRCYTVENPNTPMNHLLTGVEVKGLDPKSKFVIVPISFSSQPANYYDELTPAIEAEVNAILDKSASKITPAAEKEMSLASSNMEGNLEYRVRNYLDLLVLNAVIIQNTGNLKAGDTYAYCYAFKKLK